MQPPTKEDTVIYGRNGNKCKCIQFAVHRCMEMARWGFRVFPANVDKTPIGHWPTKATTNPKIIAGWFDGPTAAPAYGVVAHLLVIVTNAFSARGSVSSPRRLARARLT
jgi:Bifunctional DNA primase/polymerase, N-terminal